LGVLKQKKSVQKQKCRIKTGLGFITFISHKKNMNLKTLSDQIEQVSQKYTKVYGIIRDDDWFVFKLQEEVGELTKRYLMRSDRGRQK